MEYDTVMHYSLFALSKDTEPLQWQLQVENDFSGNSQGNQLTPVENCSNYLNWL